MMTIINGINVNVNLNEGNNVIQAYGFLVGGGESELLALSGRPSEFEGKNVNDLFLEALKRERPEWEQSLSNDMGDEYTQDWVRKIFRIVDNGGEMDVLHVVQGTDDFNGSYPDLPGDGEDTIFRDEEWLNKAEMYLPEEDENGEDMEVRMNLEHNGWPAFIAMETMNHLEMFYDERPSGASQMDGDEEAKLFKTLTENITKYLCWIEEELDEIDEDIDEIELRLADNHGFINYSHGRGYSEVWYSDPAHDQYTLWCNLSDDLKRAVTAWSENIIGWEV